MKKLLLASTCLLIAAGGLKAQLTPTLVKDIRPGVDWSVPTMPLNLGDKIVFVADDGTNGQELWMSDGTTAGTTMIKDIHPGGHGVTPYNVKIVMNDLVFFESV
jgi:ELWxxDGT repeat protein